MLGSKVVLGIITLINQSSRNGHELLKSKVHEKAKQLLLVDIFIKASVSFF